MVPPQMSSASLIGICSLTCTPPCNLQACNIMTSEHAMQCQSADAYDNAAKLPRYCHTFATRSLSIMHQSKCAAMSNAVPVVLAQTLSVLQLLTVSRSSCGRWLTDRGKRAHVTSGSLRVIDKQVAGHSLGLAQISNVIPNECRPD